MAFTVLSFASLEVLSSTKMNQLYANTSTIYLDGTFAFSPAETRYVSIPAHAWNLLSTSMNFLNKFYMLPDAAYCGADKEVYLPEGAIVTSVTAFWYSGNVADAGTLTLQRNSETGGADTMATCTMTANGGNHSITTTTISNATVDNQNYAYLVVVDFTRAAVNSVKFFRAQINYTITTPLP